MESSEEMRKTIDKVIDSVVEFVLKDSLKRIFEIDIYEGLYPLVAAKRELDEKKYLNGHQVITHLSKEISEGRTRYKLNVQVDKS